MVYVDSDGVLADFNSWLAKVAPDAVGEDGKSKSEKHTYRAMVDNAESCYADFDTMPGSEERFENLRTKDDWFVLTAVPRMNLLAKYSGSEERAAELHELFRENKYRWFERHGVKREKVIVVSCRADKVMYAKPGDVLIDDFPKNIAEWERHGGTGILVNSGKG